MQVRVNGVRLFVDIDGAGLVPDGPQMRTRPTVILVHGGPGADHSLFKPTFAHLTEIAQVVYYDHRGNGRSEDGDPAFWTLDQWADDLRGVCDALGIDRPVVVGVSFGGFVAQAYAIRHPGHAAKLALISTAAKMEFGEVFAAFERRGGPEARRVAEAYWTAPSDATRAAYIELCLPLYTTASRGDTDWLRRMEMRNATALAFNGPDNEHGRMDFREELRRLTCPVLLMVGEDDPITPPAFSERIAACIRPDLLTYHRLDQCGHGISPDRPQDLARSLRAFILDD